MVKIITGTVLCVILSVVLSSVCSVFGVGKDTVSTLYTVSGIMFSIGMSLTVTSNTSGIKNKAIRWEIRKEMKRVRNNFIYCFAIATCFYILFMSAVSGKETFDFALSLFNVSISFDNSCLTLVYMVYAVVYFITNFISIQSLNEGIEEELNKE